MAAAGPQQTLINIAETEIDRMNRERKEREEALKLKKLEREEEEQADYEEKKEKEKKKRVIDERIASKKKLINTYMPNLPGEGLMSKIDYQTQLTPEGMAGAIFAEYFVLAIRLLFNTDFMKQTAEYQQLKDAGLMNLIYEPDPAGNYPLVYRVDPSSGEIDYDNIVPNGEASNFEIRMNGLVPIPSWSEGLLAALDQYMGDVLGQGGLTAEQKVRAYGVLEAADNQMRSGRNVARDRAAMQALQQQPRPVPKIK